VAARVEERAPIGPRLFVAVFLSAFILCGFLGIEAWPLTGWRLFSHLRTSTLTTWQAQTVDVAGRATPLRFGQLPRAYRNFALIMKNFVAQPPGEQAAACADWAQAARDEGRQVQAVRIYRLQWDLSQRVDDRARPTGRRLVYSCEPGA
jgi:hypothetical protein